MLKNKKEPKLKTGLENYLLGNTAQKRQIKHNSFYTAYLSLKTKRR
jgi:hypothetical protein